MKTNKYTANRTEMVGDKIPLTMEDINKEMVKDSFFIAFSKQRRFKKSTNRQRMKRNQIQTWTTKAIKKKNKIVVPDLERRTKQQQMLAKPKQKS